MIDAGAIRAPHPRSNFARWLLDQRARADAVGMLAKAATQDAKFPSTGDVRAVSRRLNELQADAEMHEALEVAELDWAAL